MLFCLGLMCVSLPSAFSPWCLQGGASGRQRALGWAGGSLHCCSEQRGVMCNTVTQK